LERKVLAPIVFTRVLNRASSFLNSLKWSIAAKKIVTFKERKGKGKGKGKGKKKQGKEKKKRNL